MMQTNKTRGRKRQLYRAKQGDSGKWGYFRPSYSVKLCRFSRTMSS
jgi:hypothetical protein